MYIAVGDHGYNRDDENEYAHTADPVRKAAPEQNAMAQRFDVGQNRRAGRREAGDRLKEGVHEGRDVPADDKGQRAYQREEYPGQRHGHEALFGEDDPVFAAAGQGEKVTQSDSDSDSYDECPEALFTVYE